MITNAGTLALSKIELDGAKDSFVPEGDGGLILNAGELTLGAGATLRNSAVTGKGGAVYSEGTVNMSEGSRIEESTASSGSAICIESGIGERSNISEPIWNRDVNAPE